MRSRRPLRSSILKVTARRAAVAPDTSCTQTGTPRTGATTAQWNVRRSVRGRFSSHQMPGAIESNTTAVVRAATSAGRRRAKSPSRWIGPGGRAAIGRRSAKARRSSAMADAVG